MKSLKRAMALTKIFGIGAVAFMGLGMMALQDIYHGEANAKLEWWLVRILFFIFGLFVVATFFTMRQVRKSIPDMDKT